MMLLMDGTEKSANGYFITKEIKNSGKDLRFRFKITAQISRIQQDMELLIFQLILNSPDRGNVFREWKGIHLQINYQMTEIQHDGYGSI
jgi:hypothetical protein